ncbi:hypothetical protein TNCT_364001 [Trichonephila clavata]|uniref:Uncharacterized protein n=1 Tax=Trichonephila clavata TaxID=2740835 RepID=A0A8X6M3V5_TRICU|nr:hypothetical protein TNCT_364001 [Trichonephila clavata]
MMFYSTLPIRCNYFAIFFSNKPLSNFSHRGCPFLREVIEQRRTLPGKVITWGRIESRFSCKSILNSIVLFIDCRMEIDIHKMRKPNVNEEMAVELVRTLYGLEVIDIKNMVSFNDQNFRIKMSSLRLLQTSSSCLLQTSSSRLLQTSSSRLLQTSSSRLLQTSSSCLLQTSSSRLLQTFLQTSFSRLLQTSSSRLRRTASFRLLRSSSSRLLRMSSPAQPQFAIHPQNKLPRTPAPKHYKDPNPKSNFSVHPLRA